MSKSTSVKITPARKAMIDSLQLLILGGNKKAAKRKLSTAKRLLNKQYANQ